MCRKKFLPSVVNRLRLVETLFSVFDLDQGGDLVRYVEEEAVRVKKWSNYIPVAESLQENLLKFVQKGIEGNDKSAKHYPDSVNSTRKVRLERDASGTSQLRVKLFPPTARSNQKESKSAQEPRDVILLDRHDTIQLIIEKAIEHRLANNNETMSPG
ncbi:unnamed protein product, partial [Didymodactylos carnosus]